MAHENFCCQYFSFHSEVLSKPCFEFRKIHLSLHQLCENYLASMNSACPLQIKKRILEKGFQIKKEKK